jgi:hypothetical protein
LRARPPDNFRPPRSPPRSAAHRATAPARAAPATGSGWR